MIKFRPRLLFTAIVLIPLTCGSGCLHRCTPCWRAPQAILVPEVRCLDSCAVWSSAPPVLAPPNAPLPRDWRTMSDDGAGGGGPSIGRIDQLSGEVKALDVRVKDLEAWRKGK